MTDKLPGYSACRSMNALTAARSASRMSQREGSVSIPDREAGLTGGACGGDYCLVEFGGMGGCQADEGKPESA